VTDKRRHGSEHFGSSELRILWYLKRNGPMTRGKSEGGIQSRLADELRMKVGTVRWALRELERKCVVLRHYKNPKAETFTEGGGQNPMIRLELVDPNMALPPEPAPIPLAVHLANENDELLERTEHEPERDDVIEALVLRAVELQTQVNKLQDIVQKLNAQNDDLTARLQQRIDRDKAEAHERRKPPAHLSQSVRDVLTPEQWEALKHK